MDTSLIEVRALHKSYRQGFWMKQVEAVKGISFDVQAGDIFGFLGPNGAGKTTTIKMLTGLIRPTAGEARMFGQDVGLAQCRARLGFLPENPYVYPYLSAREFVHLCGRLSGLARRHVAERTSTVLKQVGLAGASDRPTRSLSKGMLQRAGLAAALVADPELLILDEPMSGLDPVGRKEVRDLILSEREAGRTIFFSSHILTDVEVLCERVAILRQGKVVVQGALRELLKGDVQRSEVVIADPEGTLDGFCQEQKLAHSRRGSRLMVEVEGEAATQELICAAVGKQLAVRQVSPHQETLEALFVREAIEGEAPDAT